MMRFVSTIIQRFQAYRLMHNKRKARPDVARLKAQEAEEFVAKLLRQSPQVKSIHTSKLIPDPDRHIGSGECDIIAVTERAVLALECKNYVGAIVRNGDDIAQQRLIDSGKNLDILPKIKRKADHLQRHLNSVTNSGDLWVQHLVVLCNEFGDPTQEVLDMPHVADCFSLLDKIESLTHNCEPFQQETLDSVTSKIDGFAEYDQVIFDSGKVLYGHIEEASVAWARDEYSSISVSPRGLISTLFYGVRLNIESKKWDAKVEQSCVEDSQLNINIPWKNGITNLQLSDVKQVVFGKSQEEVKSPTFESLSSRKVPLSKAHKKSLNKVLKQRSREFSVGEVLRGRKIIKHLGDGRYPHSMLVELIPGERPGLISTSCLGNLDIFDFFYQEGDVLDVKIAKIKQDGDIVLILADEKELII